MTTSSPNARLEKCYRGLTTLQSTSAMAFTSFAVIHGAQIAVAAVNSTDKADSWLLLGRPFYQDQYLETLVVTGAATAHVLAGVGKAIIRHRCWQQPWVKASSHTWTGYLLIPVLGAHYALARLLPARHFGDSAFVDFGLIAWGLQNRPTLTYTLHGALVGLGVYHFMGGAVRLATATPSPDTTAKSTGRTMGTKAMAAAAGISAILLTGLFSIGRVQKIPLRLDFAKIYQRFVLN